MNNKGQLNIASIQMVSSSSVETNLDVAEELVAKAKAAGADLAVLPEYFCLMGHSDTDKVKVRETFGSGFIQDRLKKIARKHKIYLVAGTIPLSSEQPNKVRNTSLVFDCQGEVIARYDKIHLFGFKQGEEEYQESNTIEPGSKPTSFEIRVNNETWRFGLTVCYDLRFPELYREIGIVDCHILSAAFTYTTGKSHWEILLRARAIENQCYVLASAQGGRHENGRTTWGQSMLIDPWGEIKSELKDGQGFVIGQLEKSMIHEIRAKLPSLQHRTL
ncbi:MAG: carbon-nitrogen hydrolase family protein [Polynucleobacter victoriensis]